MILWEECKEDFCRDGSLRDVYISPANLADWRAVYLVFRDSADTEFSIDGIAQTPPATVDQVFAVRPANHPMLRVKAGPADAVFHFFSVDEIECDFVPNRITSQTHLDELLNFVRQLGDTTCKRVLVTPENGRDIPFLHYDPTSREFRRELVSAQNTQSGLSHSL